MEDLSSGLGDRCRYHAQPMLELNESPSESRYLAINSGMSDLAWNDSVAAVLKWLASSSNTLSESRRVAMQRIISAPLLPTSIPVLVVGNYADIPAGHVWDTIFRRRNISHCETTKCVLKFGTIYDRMVNESLDHGWSQVAVLDFPNGTPELWSELPVCDKGHDETWNIGLCCSDDYANIKHNLSLIHI